MYLKVCCEKKIFTFRNPSCFLSESILLHTLGYALFSIYNLENFMVQLVRCSFLTLGDTGSTPKKDVVSLMF